MCSGRWACPAKLELAQSSAVNAIYNLRYGGEQEELIHLRDGAITAHLLVQDRENNDPVDVGDLFKTAIEERFHDFTVLHWLKRPAIQTM